MGYVSIFRQLSNAAIGRKGRFRMDTREISGRLVPREHLFNWFRCRDRIALGAVEGFNNKVKVTSRKSSGFRSFDVLKIALYHPVGKLPEPESTHKFC